MIISTDKIASKCQEKDNAVIWPFNINDNKGNPAKVELHLGAKCYCSSTPDKIIELGDGSSVIIAPNSIFLFQTLEKVILPKNISGRMGLKMSQVAKGLLMSNQTQVDPGYSNNLFGMIYNLSDQNVTLKYNDAITTLELFETEESQDPFFTYSGSMQECTFATFVGTRIHSSLGNLESGIRLLKDDVERSQKKWDRRMTLLSVLLAFITLMSPIAGYRAAFKDDAAIARMEEKVSNLQTIVQRYEDSLNHQAEQLDRYEQIIKDLEKQLDAAAADTSSAPEP